MAISLTTEFTYIKIPRKAASGDKPPDLGVVAEEMRKKLSDDFDVYPPNLNTAINQDGSITITAVNPDSGLNIQLQIKNLALAASQSGQLPTPPPEGAQPPPPVTPPAPAQPPNMMAPTSTRY